MNKLIYFHFKVIIKIVELKNKPSTSKRFGVLKASLWNIQAFFYKLEIQGTLSMFSIFLVFKPQNVLNLFVFSCVLYRTDKIVNNFLESLHFNLSNKLWSLTFLYNLIFLLYKKMVQWKITKFWIYSYIFL